MKFWLAGNAFCATVFSFYNLTSTLRLDADYEECRLISILISNLFSNFCKIIARNLFGRWFPSQLLWWRIIKCFYRFIFMFCKTFCWVWLNQALIDSRSYLFHNGDVNCIGNRIVWNCRNWKYHWILRLIKSHLSQSTGLSYQNYLMTFWSTNCDPS